VKNLINKYTLIVFDLDGTLVHTTSEYRYYIVPKVLEKMGQDTSKITPREIDKFWFDGKREETIKKQFKVDPYKFWKLFHAYDKPVERKRYTRAYDDVIPALSTLKKQGKLLAVTTGAPRRIAKMEIGFLPGHYFDKIISVTSSRYKNKPHPESLFACVKYCKNNISESVYIGNSNEDSIYASAAGVDFIYMERQEHDFEGRAVATIHSLLQLV
jgi:phosphoglycolate phosphatase-like HAD superfamily hydrolase